MNTFYRAMSLDEFSLAKERDFLGIGAVWTNNEVSATGKGYSLKAIKGWVDDAEETHDLIVEVQGKGLEFRLINQRAARNLDLSLKFHPWMYVNEQVIAFDRLKVVYDPEGSSGETVMALDEMLHPIKTWLRKKFRNRS